jgi:hypothetical protein
MIIKFLKKSLVIIKSGKEHAQRREAQTPITKVAENETKYKNTCEGE